MLCIIHVLLSSSCCVASCGAIVHVVLLSSPCCVVKSMLLVHVVLYVSLQFVVLLSVHVCYIVHVVLVSSPCCVAI